MKTIELDETRSTEDEESIPLRQPISIIPESDTRESHNSGSVNQKMPNPFIVDSVIPFLDGGSDRKCKRKTFICKMCDTSFFTSNELTEHALVHAQEALESDSDYDSQNQECDPSYKRRLKYRQHGSVRSKKSSPVKDVDQDSESESEQRPAVKNSGKNKSIARSRRASGQSDADRENVQCPYCKTLTTKRGRRAHTKSSFCSLTEKQYDRESRFRGKLTWVPVPENPAFITWRLTAPEKSPFRRKTTQPDDLNFHDVSNHMSEVYENMPDCPNVNDRPAIPISTAAKDLVHAGPRSRIMTEQFSFISSAVVMAGGRRENGIGERYAHNHYVSSKTKSRPDSNPEKLDVSTNLQATQRTGLPDDTVQRMEEVNRDGQSEDYDHDRTSNMISPPEDVYDDLQEEHDVNQRRDTSEHSSFLQVNSDDDDDNSNLLHNQSVLTEELHSDYDDQSSATEEFTINEETSRGGGDPSTRKNLGHEIVQCPHCGKSMLQKSLQRHTERACPTQTTRKAKNSSSNARTLKQNRIYGSVGVGVHLPKQGKN
ncbi:hypothetical protein Ocin01_09521 [Orchesella cincta]|uniref:C2H2-type domain-containing protein n=1 Tax=Orchesella cincta TaxID=48709 RepID=A0A1D2MW24_ORCCI|nr:hypothetical protein Ocin01_09521 [Orchesella cincta]